MSEETLETLRIAILQESQKLGTLSEQELAEIVRVVNTIPFFRGYIDMYVSEEQITEWLHQRGYV